MGKTGERHEGMEEGAGPQSPCCLDDVTVCMLPWRGRLLAHVGSMSVGMQLSEAHALSALAYCTSGSTGSKSLAWLHSCVIPHRVRWPPG